MKRSSSKFLSLLLAGVMVASTLTACGKDEETTPNTEASTEVSIEASSEASTESASTETGSDTPLVVGEANFSEKFTPFFADSVPDQEIVDLTQIYLAKCDRAGALVEKGIEGETRSYNGTDYTYTGLADMDVSIDEAANETVYHFKLREDVVFSDGTPLTADDVIFTFYVMSDPSYDGGSSLYSTPIKGMKNYRANSTIAESITAEEVAALVEEMPEELAAQVSENIIAPVLTSEFDWCGDVFADYDFASQEECFAGLYSLDESYSAEGKDKDTIIADIIAQYGADVASLGSAYAGDAAYFDADVTSLAESYIVEQKKAAGEGEDVPNIEGIQKLGDYELQVVTNGFDATAVYNIAQIPVAPLHYYGDTSLYDYDNNQFGFTRGDLSAVHAKDTTPLGAGPYKYVKYENKIVYLEANENYFKGEPKIKNMQWKETTEADKIPAVQQGTLDISGPTASKANLEQIKGINTNGELTGDVMETRLTDYRGYGYIGINADRICVGGERDSDASKNLRKALATVISVYRDVAIDTYYGDAASVINYPISNTSWAAPQKSDADYQVAFSVDVDGNPIYTDGMSDEDKYAAALQASLGFFEAAGYTVADGKVTAAPDGAAMEYEIWIGADGTGDHPSFGVLTDAKAALESIGITLTINDLTDTSQLWSGLDAGTVDMWCAAWQATLDPDMYQVYHSSNVEGMGGTDSNHYHVTDADLDELIMTARTSADQAYRKSVYKQCLDIVIDWAVEIPVYQRQDCSIFSTERIKADTITPDLTTFYGWYEEVENMEMN